MHLKLYDNSLITKYLHTLKYMHSVYSHKPILAVTVDPNSEDNKFDYLLNGVFTIQSLWDSNYNDTERAWINTLQCKVPREIDLSLTLEDFKQFFKAKQKCTASSPSSCHMGHYKPCLNVCTTTKPQHMKKMYIAQIVILTIMPLTQWQRASKVMIEIGKGQFIKNVWIIQLVKAYPNFILHVFWGSNLHIMLWSSRCWISCNMQGLARHVTMPSGKRSSSLTFLTITSHLVLWQIMMQLWILTVYW